MSEQPPDEHSFESVAADPGRGNAVARKARRTPPCTAFIAVAGDGLTGNEDLACRPKTVFADKVAACS